jgi:acyl-homoserine-lactone acylase
MLTVPFKAGVGFLEPVHGNSYIQTVTWDDEGAPVAEAVLSYSQSPHSDSLHRADQTRLYSAKQRLPLPFAEADVLADPELTVLHLTT